MPTHRSARCVRACARESCRRGRVLSCQHVGQSLDKYMKWEALQEPNLFQHLVFGYFFLFSGYWLINLLWSIPTLLGAWRMHVFYRDRLKITTRDLQTMDWCVLGRGRRMLPGHLA